MTSPPPPSPPLDAVDMRLRFRAPHLSLPLTRSGRPPPPPVPFLNGPPARFHHGMTMVKWGRFGYARHPRQGVNVIHGCTGEVGAPVPVEARVVVQGGNTGQTVCRAVVASGKGGLSSTRIGPTACSLTHRARPFRPVFWVRFRFDPAPRQRRCDPSLTPRGRNSVKCVRQRRGRGRRGCTLARNIHTTYILPCLGFIRTPQAGGSM